jgi:uncharacterized protein YukE
MTTVSLDYAEMKRAAGVLSAKEQAIAAKLAHVKGIADALVASDFQTTKAAPAYDVLVGDVVKDLGSAIAAITGFADFLRKAADAYRGADQSLAEKLEGGGATSTLRLDMTELTGLKSNLKATQSAFNGVHEAVAGLDSGVLGHEHLADKVQDFATGWEKRRKQITEDVDNIYDALTAIVDAFTQVDSDLNSALTNGE